MHVLLQRAPKAEQSQSRATRWPAKAPWVLAIAVSGWFVWAYVHLRPAAGLLSTAHPWEAYGPWAWGHLAYSDVVSLYYAFHLANHALPYVHTRVEYPVLIGVFMWLAAWAPGVQGYFAASSVCLLACALGTVYFLWRIDRRFAWCFGFCPLLLVYGLLNWDLLAIFFMVAGWAQFRARRHASAGILLSLAVWAKFFPVILLFYCVVSLLRAPKDRGHAVTMTLWAAGVALLVNLPFALANVGNWDHFFVFNVRRGGGGGILYELHLASMLSIPAVDILSGVVVLLIVLLFVPRVLRGGSPVGAAAIAFGAFLLVNKVYSPQYMLWLFVFAVLADWPVWSLVLMSVAGLADYADAMTALYLSHTHSPAFSWFFHTLYGWNTALRNSSIALALGGGLIRCQRRVARLAHLARCSERVGPESCIRWSGPARTARQKIDGTVRRCEDGSAGAVVSVCGTTCAVHGKVGTVKGPESTRPSTSRQDHLESIRLAIILTDGASVEFEVNSYEVFADGRVAAHLEDGGIQTFRAETWIDVDPLRCP